MKREPLISEPDEYQFPLTRNGPEHDGRQRPKPTLDAIDGNFGGVADRASYIFNHQEE